MAMTYDQWINWYNTYIPTQGGFSSFTSSEDEYNALKVLLGSGDTVVQKLLKEAYLPSLSFGTWEEPDYSKYIRYNEAYYDKSKVSQALARSKVGNTSKYQKLYEDIASGNVSISPDQFNLIFTNEDRGISEGEFNNLPPELQAYARANPQKFLQTTLANRNSANGDLLSIGAEGGYSNYNTAGIDQQGNIQFDPRAYMQVNDEGALGGLGSTLGSLAAIALAPATGGASLALYGAAGGALGAALGGEDIMKGALMGGLGGFGAGGGFGTGLFGKAATGALQGGVSSAMGGGDFLSGALKGGIGGGFGSWANTQGWNPIVKGAVGGALNTGLSGGNWGAGALAGGLSAAGGWAGSSLGKSMNTEGGWDWSNTLGSAGSKLGGWLGSSLAGGTGTGGNKSNWGAGNTGMATNWSGLLGDLGQFGIANWMIDKDISNISGLAEKGSFRPYTLRSGMGSAIDGVSSLSGPWKQQQDALMQQVLANLSAANADPQAAAADAYAKMQALTANDDQTKRNQLENRLAAQGMLGSTGGAGQMRSFYDALNQRNIGQQLESIGLGQQLTNNAVQRALSLQGGAMKPEAALMDQMKTSGMFGNYASQERARYADALAKAMGGRTQMMGGGASNLLSGALGGAGGLSGLGSSLGGLLGGIFGGGSSSSGGYTPQDYDYFNYFSQPNDYWGTGTYDTSSYSYLPESWQGALY